jgi:hypothetical protein
MTTRKLSGGAAEAAATAAPVAAAVAPPAAVTAVTVAVVEEDPGGPAAGGGALPAATGPVPRMPMARAARITLFEREVRERLSRSALDLVFARAELLSEGQEAERGGRRIYFGSTMLTIDLPELSHVLRDACDAGTARRLVALMEADADVPHRIREIARREVARILGRPVEELSVHVAIRAQGAKVFVDVDVEAAPQAAKG